MRIAYAIMGEGRGHVTRLAAVLPHFNAESIIFAGGDAHRFLVENPLPACKYELVEVPTLKFAYGNGRIRVFTSFRRNLQHVFDFKSHTLHHANLGRHSVTRLMEEKVQKFQPDIIVSDSEPFIQHIHRDVPLILFDRFAKIAFCEKGVNVPFPDNLMRQVNISFYRFMMGRPDHVIATSFYAAPTLEKYKGWVDSVGPILKPSVLTVAPSNGDHVVVYATHHYIYTPQFIDRLKALKREVRVYGAGRTGSDGLIQFLNIEPGRFIEDVASSAFVITTPGNVLLSELNHLRKKAVLLWTKSVEQQENVLYAQKICLASIIRDVNRWNAQELEKEVFSLPPSEKLEDSTLQVVSLIKSFVP